MAYLTISFFTSLLITLLVIRTAKTHGGLSADHELSGPQKFHSRPVPRIGGVGVFVAVVAGALACQMLDNPEARLMWLLIACALPALVSGLAEDLTKNVSPRRRLFFTCVSACLGIWLLEAVVRRTAILGVDYLITFTPFAIILTAFVVAGVANAVNIIDGFNGLASMCVIMMLLAVAYVAFQVSDSFVLTASLIVAGAVIGFFAWNYPAGLIFLGDGGAYFLGFVLAELSVMLLHRNPTVSPMFALLMCAYPIFETIFSIYRKKFLRGISPGVPDGVHLHMLVYKRLIRWAVGSREAHMLTKRNSMTSPYLWLLCLSSIVPSMLWWDSTPILASCIAAFILTYVLLYWSIVRFKAPKWLVFRNSDS